MGRRGIACRGRACIFDAVANRGRALWLSWSAMLAALGASLVAPFVAGPNDPWWPDARTTVLAFALTLLAMVAGVGSLALRETLVRDVASGAVDPDSPEGAARVGAVLLRAWALCVVVALLGAFVACVSAEPGRAWPYAMGAAALLLFHAPGRALPGRA